MFLGEDWRELSGQTVLHAVIEEHFFSSKLFSEFVSSVFFLLYIIFLKVSFQIGKQLNHYYHCFNYLTSCLSSLEGCGRGVLTSLTVSHRNFTMSSPLIVNCIRCSKCKTLFYIVCVSASLNLWGDGYTHHYLAV